MMVGVAGLQIKNQGVLFYTNQNTAPIWYKEKII